MHRAYTSIIIIFSPRILDMKPCAFSIGQWSSLIRPLFWAGTSISTICLQKSARRLTLKLSSAAMALLISRCLMNLFKVTAVLRSEAMLQGSLGNHLTQPSDTYAPCPITYITQADSMDAALLKVWRHITQDPDQVVISISVNPLSNVYFLP